MLGMELISILFSTLLNCNINEHLCSKIAGLKGIPFASDLAVYFLVCQTGNSLPA